MSALTKPRAVLALAAFILLLLAAACDNSGQLRNLHVPSTPRVDAPPLVDEIPPCTPIAGATQLPCNPDSSFVTEASGPQGHWIDQYDQPETLRQMMDGVAFVAHIVVRGTIIPDTARCTAGNPYRPPAYDEPDLVFHTSVLQCYVDVRANSYILGSGPAQVTALWSFNHYWDKQYEESATEEGLTLAEYLEAMVGFRAQVIEGDAELELPGIYGQEAVFFLGPSHNQAVEVWQRLAIWDVQMPDDDNPEIVQVVHPDRDLWRQYRPDDYQTYRSRLENTLPAFTAAVRAAHNARVTEYGGRIAPANADGTVAGVELPMLVSNVNQLDDFYRDTGAYADPDDSPVPPPPACGLAVPDGAANISLVSDCITLMEIRDPLRRSVNLNWDPSLAISDWAGITTGTWSYTGPGSPLTRVTKIKLRRAALTGVIPADLGDLLALTELDLSGNSLTGEIPPELGNLEHLTVLRLHGGGNTLTGCTPPALRDVATNDLDSLGLPYCPEAPSGLRETSSGETRVSVRWDSVANASKYRVESLSREAARWVISSESVTDTSHTVTGLACYDHHGVRVSAHGDGSNPTATLRTARSGSGGFRYPGITSRMKCSTYWKSAPAAPVWPRSPLRRVTPRCIASTGGRRPSSPQQP